MAQDKHEVVPEITAEARANLPPAEFQRALHEGEEAGEHASSSQGLRWVLALLIGAGIVAAIVYDWRVLFPTAALMIFYSMPIILAARMTASERAKAEVLSERAQHPTGPPDTSAESGSPASRT
ncbi:MAG: hypothetical protein GC161_05505 [Planctomycetaceae bacterium]|nr:hypothetical protein [Planctomycetaceae bacterium]